MNRIIKFRAWNKEKNIMVYDNEDDTCGDWDGCCNSNVGMVNTILDSKYYEKYEFMQFTGLHDKNGKEIYEGDIVGDSEIKWTVKWNKHRMGFSLYPTTKQLYDEMPVNVNNKLGFKVIGNIYDNSELLGGE